MSQPENQETIPNLLLRHSIDVSSSQDPGSCDTIPTEKLDFYISQKIDEMLKRQISSFSTPHHKIFELLNGFFVDFENEKKEAWKIISLKNNEVETLKSESLKLKTKNSELEAEINRLHQETSQMEAMKSKTNQLIKEISKKDEEIQTLNTRLEQLLKQFKENNDEKEENQKKLVLVSEENKKLKELKEQLIKYYKRKVSDLKKQCLAMAAKAKRVIANIEKSALSKEIQFASPSVEERKSDQVQKLRTSEPNSLIQRKTLENKIQIDDKFESLRLEAKSSSELEKIPETDKREKLSYQPGTTKKLENPYQIKDFKREKKTHSCDFKESSPFKPQNLSRPRNT